MALKANTLADFFSFIPLDDPDENVCTPWKGKKFPNGYGHFRNQLGISRYAHRAIWEIAHGKIPEGQYVCHKCDNPSCVRLSHLYLGTPIDNMRDMFSKGRAISNNKWKKCRTLKPLPTKEEILAIRKLSSEGISNKTLAEIFKISHDSVYCIVTKRRYADV